MGLNASGRSPKSLTLEMIQEKNLKSLPSTGMLPISVPGCVDGWFELHAKFGKLPMGEVLAPAIGYCQKGFPVSELIAYYWDRSRSLGRFKEFKQTFLPDGKAPRKGQIFRNPRLGKTLQRIAKGGRDVFYRGEIAKEIDAFMKANEGYLSYEDLATPHLDVGRTGFDQLPWL